APEIEAEAREALQAKPNVRVLETGTPDDSPAPALELKKGSGGLLVQDADAGTISEQDLRGVTRVAPWPEQVRDLLFAWRGAKHAGPRGRPAGPPPGALRRRSRSAPSCSRGGSRSTSTRTRASSAARPRRSVSAPGR